MIFSSANGVQAVDERLRLQGSSLGRRPAGLRIGAVGRKTARLLDHLGAPADFVPPDFVADSLIDHFPVSGWGLRLLLPRVQSGGRTLLAEAFGEAGARVVEVPAYESRCPADMPETTATAMASGEVDAITFSSGKTVIHTAALLQKTLGSETAARAMSSIALVSIGPQTSQRCLEQFCRVDQEATPHDLDGLTQACLQVMQTR